MRHAHLRVLVPCMLFTVCVWHSVPVAVGQGDKVADLIAELSSEDPGLRRAAARNLGMLAVWEAAEPLVAVLGDAEEEVRQEAIGALEQIGEGAVDAVLEGLKSEVPGIRAGCADVLSRLTWVDDERIGLGLLSVIEDPVAEVRLLAVEGIVRIDDPRARDALKEALDDSDLRVRIQAASSLALLGDGSGLPLLLKASTNSDPAMRGATIAGLALIANPPAVQALRDLTRDEVSDVRRAAYSALIAIGSPEAFETGLIGLQDPSRTVRAEVAHRLGFMRSPGAADALLEVFQSDPSPTVRVQAGLALASIGDQRAVPILLERLGPRYRDMERVGAADALATLGSREAIKPLTDLLEDEESRIRRAARLSLQLILEECPDCP